MRGKQNGFSIFEVIIVIAVIAIVGLVGYNLYNMQQTRTQANSEAQKAAATTPPQSINSTSDLDLSAKALDAADIDATNDSTTLSNELENL